MEEEKMVLYKCDLCGNTFVWGNDTDGIPNGLQFAFSDGSIFAFCKGCVLHRYQDAIRMIEIKKQEAKQH